MLLLALIACQDYNLNSDADVTPPIEDTGKPDCPPQIPDCYDTGDSSVDDSDPDTSVSDCTVQIGPAGTVLVDEECVGRESSVKPVADAYNLKIEYQWTDTTGGNGVIVMPAVGNLTDDNGDGKVDERDVPDIAFTTWSSNTLVVLSGDGSGVHFTKSGWNGQGGVTIADVDADGVPEVVGITTGNQIVCANGSGAVEWTSSSFPMMAYPQPTVADLDADGKPEVIGDVGVVNGEDGSTVATLTGISNSWRTPVAADIDLDGTQEIILGNKVFSHTGALEWSNGGTGAGNFNAVANLDSDAEAEVIFVSGSTAYLHEDDGTLIDSFAIPGTNPGPPSVADFDGDGEIELAVPANTKLSVFDFDGSKLWDTSINDTSGLAGVSGYDMDGDGAYEVLYADQDALRMYDGATGTILYESYSHSSGTVWEYPVIADIDRDDSAEICIASNGSGGGGTWKGVTCFGHDGDGWPKSGPTWGTHDFALTNLDADGSVPVKPDPSWQLYNVFRARPAVDDTLEPTGNLAGRLTDFCLADCDDGPIRVSFQVWNDGGSDIEETLPFSVYRIDGSTESFLQTGFLPAVPSGVKPQGQEIEIHPNDWGTNGIVIRLDDDGTGVIGGLFEECDEQDNEIWFAESLCN